MAITAAMKASSSKRGENQYVISVVGYYWQLKLMTASNNGMT